SRFLLDLLESPETQDVVEQLADWAPMPEPAADLANPSPPDQERARWPLDPVEGRRPALEAGAARVRAAIADPVAVDPERPGRWDEEIAVLLAERERAHPLDLVVELPAHLSASRLVRLAENP